MCSQGLCQGSCILLCFLSEAPTDLGSVHSHSAVTPGGVVFTDVFPASPLPSLSVGAVSGHSDLFVLLSLREKSQPTLTCMVPFGYLSKPQEKVDTRSAMMSASELVRSSQIILEQPAVFCAGEELETKEFRVGSWDLGLEFWIPDSQQEARG